MLNFLYLYETTRFMKIDHNGWNYNKLYRSQVVFDVKNSKHDFIILVD